MCDKNVSAEDDHMLSITADVLETTETTGDTKINLDLDEDVSGTILHGEPSDVKITVFSRKLYFFQIIYLTSMRLPLLQKNHQKRIRYQKTEQQRSKENQTVPVLQTNTRHLRTT